MSKDKDFGFDEKQLMELGLLIKKAREVGPSEQNIAKNRKEVSEMSFKDFLIQLHENSEVVCHVKSDNLFTRKARILQTLRRHESKALPGYIVKNEEKIYYGNLALNGKEKNYNFLSDEIFEYAKKRLDKKNKKSYETIDEERLMCNFLSSQPMAFNLFYPLMKMVKDGKGEEMALVLKSFIDKDDKLNISKITEVGIEYIPSYYKDCIGDRTAMDAYFVYETADLKKGIVAVETKYTDVLGKNETKEGAKDDAKKKGRDRQKQIIFDELSELFTKDLLKSIEEGNTKLTQLFRNFLLTEKVRIYSMENHDMNLDAELSVEIPERYDDSVSIVLAPKDNISNKQEEDILKNGLNEQYKYKFQTIDLESFVEKLIEIFPDEDIFKKFYKRYLDF